MMKVGVIGGGRIGRTHAKALSMLNNIDLYAIADPIATDLEDFAKSVGIKHVYKDYKKILEDKDIQAVFICTPSDTHYNLSLESLDARKHTFCEKPVDLEISRVKDIQDKVKAVGVQYMVSFQRRFDIEFMAMKEAINDGRVGKVELVEITSRDPKLSSMEFIKSSGGIFCDFMIHDIDMVYFLTGQEVVSVYALGNALIDPAIKTEAGDVDTAVAALELESGAMCVITNSRRASYGYDQRAEVHGSNGCIMNGNQFPNNSVYMGKDGIVYEKPLPYFLERYINAFSSQAAQFINAIESGKQVPVTIEDALRALIIAKAAMVSLDEGRKVLVSELTPK